jgi:hypothetical protein
MLGAAAMVALSVGALLSVPASAQAAALPCLAQMSYTKWHTEVYVGDNKPCQLVQARESVYNNYGLAGTYTGAQSSGVSHVTVSPSSAPGTSVSHSFRYKAPGKSWSAWQS